MGEAELRFLAALKDATRRGVVRWLRDTNDPERDVYRAGVGAESIEVEFVYVLLGDGRTAERLVVRVSGLGVYFQSAIGTPVYNAVMEMLALQIFGWAEGSTKCQLALARAVERIETLVASVGVARIP